MDRTSRIAGGRAGRGQRIGAPPRAVTGSATGSRDRSARAESGGKLEKLRVGLLFGGRSVEHEVSIVSARSILSALDRTRYEVSLLGIDPDGRWHLADAETPLVEVFDAPEIFLPPIPAPGGSDRLRLDVLFPIVHGRGGEDGSLQGLLDLTEIPYVGSGVLSSAVQMDKDVAKRLLSAAGLPVTPWIAFSAARLAHDGLRAAADRAAEEIGLPAFVKPANSGSSVGISRADSVEDLVGALAEALRYDRKILVEAAVTAREIEVAVLGNEDPRASVPGEIRARQAFYDYDAKYRDDSTELVIPADLDPSQVESLQETAIAAYRALEAEGMARVDFLVEQETGLAVINELNSLPGFTDVSMYPKLWEASGLPYPALLDRLIELALERHAARAKLETQAPPAMRDGA